MVSYVRPDTMSEALECRAGGAEILAGGTDFWPVRAAKTGPLTTAAAVLDLSALDGLRNIDVSDGLVRIGALATWTDVAASRLPPAARALQQAAIEIGGRQIQNRGTVGGNLCNASPAADGVPPLLALDAAVELASRAGTRTIPLSSFLLGPRRTALRADEILTGLSFPVGDPGARSVFLKLGARKYQLISIVMGAAIVEIADSRIARMAIALGACSPVARRLHRLEAELMNVSVADAVGVVGERHISELAPIDDVRGDAEYRREAAIVLLRRMLAACCGQR